VPAGWWQSWVAKGRADRRMCGCNHDMARRRDGEDASGCADRLPAMAAGFYNASMSEGDSARSFVIVGLTRQGTLFRPSDWAERLAGIMAPFQEGYVSPSSEGSAASDPRPETSPTARQASSAGQNSLHAAGLLYSPFVMPILVSPPGTEGSPSLRAVRVDGRLQQIEAMAYAFLRQFAIDNDLLTTEGVQDS